jgi:hypothetical protein
VRAALADPADLLRQDGALGIQRVPGVAGDEPGVPAGLGVQPLAVAAQPVLPGQDPGGPVLRPGPEGGDRPVAVQPGRARAQQRVQAPVHPECDRVPGPPSRGDRVAEGEVGADRAARDAEGGQVQHRAGRDGGRQGDGT